MKRALVTGDKGFVGRHVALALHYDGFEVTGLDTATDPDQDVRRYFPAHSERFDLVVHCAAIVGGRAMIEGEPLAVAVDLAIDADLFAWAVRTKPGRVVYFSSSAAYPTYLQEKGSATPLRESMIDLAGGWAAPDLTYGWAKLTGEMLAAHARADGVPITILRPFSGYGPDQSLDYPFPNFIRRARHRDDPFDIWGDGQQLRDWVHIDDIVAMTMLCVREGIDGPLNVCTGRAVSFLELQRLVCHAMRYTPEVRLHPDKPAGVHARVADPAAMLEVFTPRVTLEEGIFRALEEPR